MVRPTPLLSIQYLRGLAALAVVLVHAGWISAPQGAAGVDVFFVISGFIMMYVSYDVHSSLAFLEARALRVLPLYWVLTLLAAALRPVEPPLRILAALTLVPTLRADGEWAPVLVQGWTLTYEALFYLVFAVVLQFPIRHRLGALTAFMLLAASYGLAKPNLGDTIGINPTMFLEFLAGVWVCQSWRTRQLPTPNQGVAIALFGIFALFLQPTAAASVWRPLAWGLPAASIVLGMVAIEAGRSIVFVRGLKLLGDASYSLYLTHVMVMWAAKPLLVSLPLIIALPAVISICVAIGIAVHLWIERPLGQGLKNAYRKHFSFR